MPAPAAPKTDIMHSSHHALVVDDAFLLRQLIKGVLGKVNIDVVEAASGADALQKLREHGPSHFSFVIIDLVMPEMSGVELLREAKKEFNDKLPPVLICSAHKERDDIKQLATLGINGYILKPLDPQLLLKKIHEIIPDLPGIEEHIKK